jgi:metal-responsive CopG/Arc/MetJ family transcriptional regulator
MNFSVHMDEKTLSELTQAAQAKGLSRSALLTQAFKQYVTQQQLIDKNNGWPKALIDHLKKATPINCPDFDDTSDLLQLKKIKL